MALWDEVKANIVEWYTTAAERTEELARLGIRTYDRFGISRDIERQFAELGSHVHRILAVEGGEDVAQDESVQRILSRIRQLEQELRRKQDEIDELRGRRPAAAGAHGSGAETSEAAAGAGSEAHDPGREGPPQAD